MSRWILLTILFNLAAGHVDEWNMVHFSKSSSEIEECLIGTSSWNVIRNYINSVGWRKWILDQFSQNLMTRSVEVEYINRSATFIVDILRSEVVLNNAQIPHVRVALVRAVMNCSDSEEEFDYQTNFHNLPHFVEEIPEMADLLNIILVDARSLYEGSIDTLNSYVQRALLLIERALRIMNTSSNLIYQLEQMWNRRSSLFYYHSEFPEYIRHIYSYEQPSPYTCDDPSFYNPRREVHFSVRNPPVENHETVFGITSFYAINWQNYEESYEYSYPTGRSFTRSQYFIKNLISLFLRFLFIYLDLIENGSIDSDNTVNSSPFSHLVPVDLEQVLYNDTAYDRYLLNRQNFELNSDFARSSPIHISFNRVVGREGRIAELDLLLIYSYRLMSVIQTFTTTTSKPITSASGTRIFPTLVLRARPIRKFKYRPLEYLTTNTTTNAATSFAMPSSTSRYKDSEETDKNASSGKSLPKKQWESNGKNEVSDENSGPSCTNKFIYMQDQVFDEYYGYFSGPDNEGYLSLKNLHDILSSVLESGLRI